MRFNLVDQVLELDPASGRIVTLKLVSSAEEYLQDHFPGFPVLPGVFMLEAMVQAARHLAIAVAPDAPRLVLGGARALKYGNFVRPGDSLRIEIALEKRDADLWNFRGSGQVLRPQAPASRSTATAESPDALPPEPLPNAVSGRFVLRPLVL